MYSRRTTLIGLTVTFAGCSAADDPADGEGVGRTTDSTPAATPEDRPQTAATTHREFLSAFGDSVASTGVVIQDLRLGPAREVVSLSYETTRAEYDALGSEIGTLSGLYFRQVRTGWTTERLDATVIRRGSDAPIAYWNAEAAWFEAYERGEVTAEDLSLRVLETLSRA
jgi:hypothetical protein